MTNESGVELLTEAESPSLLYNLAVLEAFQLSAKKTILPPGHFDTEKEVILIGGSFGKGTGTFFSDLDVVNATASISRDPKWLYLFMQRMPQEFENLVNNDYRFTGVRRYISLSSELEKGKREMGQRLRQADPVLSRPSSDVQLKERIAAQGKISLKVMDRHVRDVAVAERASRSLKSPVPAQSKFTHQVSDTPSPGDYEPVMCTNTSIINAIRNADTARGYEEMLLLLSSTPGVNAYEVTPGNLRYHQEQIVSALRELYESNIEGYKKLQDHLRLQWKEYISQTSLKYPAFFREIQKSRKGKPYTLNEFFKFDEFPEVQALETFFGFNVATYAQGKITENIMLK